MRKATLFAVAFFVISASQSHAEGLLFKLPKDGAWAQYDMELSINDNTLSSTVKISSVDFPF